MAKSEYVKREIIDDQLLVAMDDKSKVAIVLDQEGLDLLISAVLQMQQPAGSEELKRKLGELVADMKQLRRQAFA